MSSLQLSPTDKIAVETVIQKMNDADTVLSDEIMAQLANGRESAWLRFAKANYNHPLTWWVGILQLQMQSGVWGRRYQRIAAVRASTLAQIVYPTTEQIRSGRSTFLLLKIARYNLKYRKADFAGRTVGSMFTNYAATGGRMGRRVLPKGIQMSAAVLNFAISCYGAAIMAVNSGIKGVASIIHSMVVARPEMLPSNVTVSVTVEVSEDERDLIDAMSEAVCGITSLCEVSSKAVPLAEFCRQPQNVKLKGLCDDAR